MTIQAVIFDIGGVLAHDVWERLFLDDAGVRAKYPQLDKRELFRFGKAIWETFAYVPETPQNDWQALERRYWNAFIEFFRDQLPASASPDEFIQLSLNFFRPVEGMNGLLGQLQAKGLQLAICSDNNEFWFRRQAEQVGFDKFFDPDKIILSCRIGASKKSTRFEMFSAVAAALRVEKAHCLFVDDRATSIERAQQFGITGILFPSHAAFGAAYLQTLLAKMEIPS